MYCTAWCKNCFPRLKFPPHFCQAKWPAHAQPIGPDETCVSQLSSINFARPCIYMRKVETFRKPRNKSGSVSVATLQSPAAVSDRVLNKESPAAKEVAVSCSRFTGHNLAAHFTSELPAALILIASAISPCNLSPLSRGWLQYLLA